MNQSAARFQMFSPIVGISILAILVLYPVKRDAEPFAAPNTQRLRLGYFPNLTHAPAIVGYARGEFQNALGAGVFVEPKVFSAGPEEMEALLAGEVDIAYVGPGPAIDTYLHSEGRALKVIAGACSGGAALVARAGTPIMRIADLDGKRVAVPQLGGTQDISLRHFMAAQGLRPDEKGGTVQIVPVKNADLLTLFKRGDLDAAWVPEPWVSRLIDETGARMVVDERSLWPGQRFATTVVAVRQAFLAQHPQQVQAFLQAHLRVVHWLQQHPQEAQQVVNVELKRLLGKSLRASVMQPAWSRITFTADLDRDNIATVIQASTEAGYLHPGSLDAVGMLEPGPLERARQMASR